MIVQLEIFCWNIQVVEECANRLNKEGLIVEVTKNRAKQRLPHPSFKIMNEATAIINKIAGRFGFDPVSRTKVPGPKKEDIDPFLELMKANR